MKLHLQGRGSENTITGYGEGYVMINQVRHEESLVVMTDRLLEGWGSAGFDALAVADFERLRELGVEVLLLGTGRRQRFPAPALLRPLIEARVGFEVMDSAAACRTYNILMGEGRRVAAALLVE